MGRMPTAQEQLLMEYANLLRAAPQTATDQISAGGAVPTNVANAIRYFGVDMTAFAQQMAGHVTVAPLAWNGNLAAAADGHNQLMIQHDTQAHQLPGEANLGARATAAGYAGWSSLGENVYAYAEDPMHAHAGFVIDWGYDAEDVVNGALIRDWAKTGDGMQDPAGHRETILSAKFQEAGFSMVAESDGKTTVGPFLVTQNFGARRDYLPQLLGVVTDDLDGDQFYDVGEGMGGITVQVSGAGFQGSTTTWASGGYQIELPQGSYKVTFSGGGLIGPVTRDVTIGAANVKLDLRAQEAVAVVIEDLVIKGGPGQATLEGGAGNDMLFGDGVEAAWFPREAGQVYRLYQAALGRTPDQGGHGTWVEALATGSRSLETAARLFVEGAEFRKVYGALDDQAFVQLLYRNVLNREADAKGLAEWTAKLGAGEARETVLLGFSNSKEFVDRTVAASDAFTKMGHEAGWVDDVYRLYQATLDRAPDFAGLTDWARKLGTGTTLESVAKGFVNSAEFRATYGALDDEGFVRLLYANVLDRTADARGLADWVGRLEAGQSRAEVVLGFSQSAEFSRSTASGLKDWMQTRFVDDTLIASGGRDQLFGGWGSDTFVFRQQEADQVVVHDLEAWDHLRFEGFGYQDVAELRSHLRQAGSSVLFEDDGVQVTLLNTQLAQLQDDQFLF